MLSPFTSAFAQLAFQSRTLGLETGHILEPHLSPMALTGFLAINYKCCQHGTKTSVQHVGTRYRLTLDQISFVQPIVTAFLSKPMQPKRQSLPYTKSVKKFI